MRGGDWSPKPRGELASVGLDDELVIYDAEHCEAHVANPTGAVLWPLFDGVVTLAELGADIAAAFDIDPVVAFHDVSEFANVMYDRGLLVDSSEPQDDRVPEPPRAAESASPRYLEKPPDP